MGFRCLNKGQGLACLWASGPVFSFQEDIMHISKNVSQGGKFNIISAVHYCQMFTMANQNFAFQS